MTILVRFVECIISVFYEPNKYSIHAEVACINSVSQENRKYISKATMYIIKLDRHNKIKESCLPCENCKKYIMKYEVAKIYS
jgi:cytidine deaminase